LKKESFAQSDFGFIHFIKAFLAAFLVTVIVSAMLSALFAHTGISDKIWDRVTGYAGTFSSFLAAFFSAAGTRKRGYLTGAFSAAGYTFLLLCVGFVVFPGAFSLESLIKKLTYSVIFGAIGGILGINTGSKRKN